MVTVFDEEVFDLFPSELSTVLTINAAEGSVWLEFYEAAEALTLSFDRYFFFCHSNEKASKPGSHNRSQFLIVAFAMPCATIHSPLSTIIEAILAGN